MVSRQIYESKKLSRPSLNYCVAAAESEIGAKIVLRFEIGSQLYFGIAPWNPIIKKNSNPESRDGVIEKYVRDHLMPVACDGSKSKYWYWQRFMAEDIDFRSCNNAYKELHDRQAFQETIERVLAEIADTLGVLMKA